MPESTQEKLQQWDPEKRRVRIDRAQDDEVFIHYGLDDAPVDGYYVLRFWPFGAHKKPSEDFTIGQLRQGEGKAGDVQWRVPGITKKTVLSGYRLDIDVWTDENAYREKRNLADLGQADKGGPDVTLKPEPPPPPVHDHEKPVEPVCPKHEPHYSCSGKIVQTHNTGRVAVSARFTVENFKGVVALVSRGRQLETKKIKAKCGAQTSGEFETTDERRNTYELCFYDDGGSVVYEYPIR